MEYKNFFIEELFRLEKGKVSNAQALKEGDEIGYVGAKYNNNGVIKYCLREESKVTKGNCIVFICDGEGSMGLSFYKSDDFMGTVNVTAGYNDNLTPNIGLYISTVANTVRGKYNFGYKRTFDRLKRETLSLPVDNSGQPDWTFMEEYIQIKTNQIKDTYQLPRQHKITDFRELDEVKWKEYFLTDIFETIKRGKRLKKSDHISGNIPYISSTKMKNGCDAFLGNQKGVRKFRNCLTIANSGSVGSVFYHDYMFIASDHVTALVNSKLTKLQYLFIASSMSKIGEKYSFNREINDARIQREIIQLPVGINGQPDFDFMEQYMKRMENRIIQKMEQ
jgi:hypothetical protein